MLQVLLSMPGDIAVTREDVAADTACAPLAAGRSELVGLALWLILQRCKVHSQIGFAPQCSTSGNQLHTAGVFPCTPAPYRLLPFNEVLPRECSFSIPKCLHKCAKAGTMQGQLSPWHDFVQSLPHTTNSPVLWSSEEQSELLQGSPALPEAQARAQALSAEWDSIQQQLTADPSQHSDSEAHMSLLLHTCSSTIADSLYKAVCMPSAAVIEPY